MSAHHDVLAWNLFWLLITASIYFLVWCNRYHQCWGWDYDRNKVGERSRRVRGWLIALAVLIYTVSVFQLQLEGLAAEVIRQWE